ncbi:hypothetical protein Ancab_036581 [Ancistrocladus abbreviatus]
MSQLLWMKRMMIMFSGRLTRLLRAAQKRIQEQLNAVTSEMVMLSTNEEKTSAKKSPECDVKPKVKDANWQLLIPKTCLPEIMDALFEALFDGVEKGFAKEGYQKEGLSSCCCSSG